MKPSGVTAGGGNPAPLKEEKASCVRDGADDLMNHQAEYIANVYIKQEVHMALPELKFLSCFQNKLSGI